MSLNKFLILFFLFIQINSDAQNNIYELMDRTDLTLSQVELWADQYFNQVGTEKGSGYKQYQRWLYERKFHIDINGNYILPEIEFNQYKQFKLNEGYGLRASNSWSELGPKSFTYTSSWNPGVGRITSVAVHPSDTTIIYVSSPGGGLWKSSNSGSTWTPLIDFVNTAWMSVYNLCIDPFYPNIIYASIINGGVIKSVNSGASWAATGNGPNNAKQVKIHPKNSNIIFCAANNGIWRSTNAGASWINVQSETKEDIEFNPADTNIMYASGSSGTSCVWRSNNNGVSWTAISSANGITNAGRTLMAVSPDSPAIVYAVQASGSLFGRMYKSVDSGKTYITTVIGNPANYTNFFGYTPNGSGTTGQATYDMAITVNPLDANEVHIAGCICFKSINGGYNFTATTNWTYPNGIGYNHSDVHALEWVNNTIYSGSDGGLYKSIDNANNFIDLSAGLGIKQYYRISCSKTDPNVITGGAQDNGSTYRRTNGSWVDWLGADGMDNAISPTNASIAIGTSQNGSIYKTINAGASYSGLPKPSNGNWVTPILMHPTNHDTIYGGWTGVWRSVNGGSNWDTISPKSFGTIDVIAIAPTNTMYIYAAKGSTLFRTSDGGNSWSTITAPSSISSIFVSKIDPAKIWFTCNSSTNRVYLSNNQGTTLTNLSSGLPSINARSIVVDEDNIETIYVGMNIGVYYRDTSNIWKVHATGLPLVAINDLEIQRSSNKLRVATYGRGVWESDMQNIPFVCPKIKGMIATNISTDSALLTWNKEFFAINYYIQYKRINDISWTDLSVSNTDTFITMKGLSDTTTYMWRIRTNCNTSISIWDTSLFTTNKNCNSAIGLKVQFTTSNSVSLTWDIVSGALEYTVSYKLTSNSIYTVLPNTNTNSIVINGLIPGDYDWNVKPLCGASNALSTASTFTIISGCDQPDSLISTHPNNTDIKLIWKSVMGANGYSIDYKLNSSSSWIAATGSVLPTITISALPAGIYDWRVKANCAANQSNFSNEKFTITIPTNLNAQNENRYQLLLFPNPAKNTILLRFKLSTKEKNIEISLYNVIGKKLFSKMVEGAVGNNELMLDLSMYSNGQYTVSLGVKGINEIKNFVIVK